MGLSKYALPPMPYLGFIKSTSFRMKNSFIGDIRAVDSLLLANAAILFISMSYLLENDEKIKQNLKVELNKPILTIFAGAKVIFQSLGCI